MAITDRREHYVVAEDERRVLGEGEDLRPVLDAPGEGEDARASEHRQAALDVLAEDGCPQVALVHALLAVAERLSELSCYVAGLG